MHMRCKIVLPRGNNGALFSNQFFLVNYTRAFGYTIGTISKRDSPDPENLEYGVEKRNRH